MYKVPVLFYESVATEFFSQEVKTNLFIYYSISFQQKIVKDLRGIFEMFIRLIFFLFSCVVFYSFSFPGYYQIFLWWFSFNQRSWLFFSTIIVFVKLFFDTADKNKIFFLSRDKEWEFLLFIHAAIWKFDYCCLFLFSVKTLFYLGF